MAEQNLEKLIGRFHPRRTYKSGEVTVEVDGVFVRVDEETRIENGRGFVPIEDFLQDSAIIRSARVSTGRDTLAINEKAAGLIGSLYKDSHVTPFEGGAMFRLRVEAPINIAQPFFQLPGSHNEFSGRYSVIDGEFSMPEHIQKNPEASEIFLEAGEDSKEVYKKFLDASMAKEQARFAVLFSFFTKFYWTVSLRHLLEICALEENKFAPRGFWDTRDRIFKKILEDWTPWAYDKFLEFPKVYKTRWAEEEADEEADDGIFTELVENIGSFRLDNCLADEKLMRRGVKTGPSPKRGFGHSILNFSLHYPIFVHRQWVRHRYGAWSELPVDFDGVVNGFDFYVPKYFREQIGKTMSYHYEDMERGKNTEMKTALLDLISRSIGRYWRMRQLGFSMADSAACLPYVFRIEALWSPNVEGLMNFFSLRCDSHAQWEIRQFAKRIYLLFARLYPWANEIFLKHINYGTIETDET